MLTPSSHFIGEDHLIDTKTLFSEVLLVEPDPAVRSMIASELTSVVGEVAEASSGQDGLRLLETHFIELVVVGSKLPDVSDTNYLQAIRQVRFGIPIVSVLAQSNMHIVLELLRNGANDCVIRTEPDQFGEELRNAIQFVGERRIREMQELEVRAERHAFYLAAETAQDGLAVLSPHGYATFSNGAFDEFCMQLGYARNTESSLDVFEVIQSQDANVAANLKDHVRTFGGNQGLWSAELEVRPRYAQSKDDILYYALTLTSVGLGSCDSLGISVSPEFKRDLLWVRDITPEKRRQQMQREIIAATSHDLKGPLGIISLAAEMLKDQKSHMPEMCETLIARIHSAAQKALVQVEEVVRLKKDEDGVHNLSPEWIHAAEMLEQLCVDYAEVAEKKHHRLSCEVASPELRVYADTVALHRVLANLITNAIKYTPEGGEIVLRAESTERFVRLSVVDNGPGIDAAARHKLFERYARLSEHAHIEGTGLGLYISNNIVKAHGGHIEVRSKRGSGSSFIVCLPVVAEEGKDAVL